MGQREVYCQLLELGKKATAPTILKVMRDKGDRVTRQRINQELWRLKIWGFVTFWEDDEGNRIWEAIAPMEGTSWEKDK